MVKYTIKMLQRVSDDLDNIYNHIADDFKEIGTAEKMADALEDAILSLDEMPYRGSIRRTGAFANRGYRQIFVKNFTIVYRIDEAKKMVVIVPVSKITHVNFEKSSEFKALLDIFYSIKNKFSIIEFSDDYGLAAGYWDSKRFKFEYRELADEEYERLERIYEEGTKVIRMTKYMESLDW